MKRSTFIQSLLASALPACASVNPLESSGVITPRDESLNLSVLDQDVARVWSTPGHRKLAAILPPYGRDHHYYDQSQLPEALARHGIDFAVLFTETTGFHQASDITRLDVLLRNVIATHNYDATKIVLGGFSAGGYGAFRYALNKLQGEPLAVLPAALISVDAPLDIERWVRGMELVLGRTDQSSPFYGESQYLTQMFKEMLGGTPAENPSAYRRQSILTASVADGGNAVALREMPMRLYAEPDMDFYIPHGLDYACINASDQVSLATILRAQGNQNVSLVLTSGRGYRADLNNMRLPHSWSIVDEPALAQWISGQV